VIFAHVCICCGEIIVEIQSFKLNGGWQQKSSKEIVKCLQKDEMFCFRVENERLFLFGGNSVLLCFNFERKDEQREGVLWTMYRYILDHLKK
jgi:hypothetical protein